MAADAIDVIICYYDAGASVGFCHCCRAAIGLPGDFRIHFQNIIFSPQIPSCRISIHTKFYDWLPGFYSNPKDSPAAAAVMQTIAIIAFDLKDAASIRKPFLVSCKAAEDRRRTFSSNKERVLGYEKDQNLQWVLHKKSSDSCSGDNIPYFLHHQT